MYYVEEKPEATALDKRHLPILRHNTLHLLHKPTQRLINSHTTLLQSLDRLLVFLPTRQVHLVPARAHHRARKEVDGGLEESLGELDGGVDRDAELPCRGLVGVFSPGRFVDAGDVFGMGDPDGCGVSWTVEFLQIHRSGSSCKVSLEISSLTITTSIPRWKHT